MRLPSGTRLAIVRWAVDSLPSRILAEGRYDRADVGRPGTWLLGSNGCRLCLTPGVLLLPTDAALSTLLDVWSDAGGKVLSTSWLPSHPWLPPRITRLRAGDWMYRLGWREQQEDPSERRH